MTRTKLSNAIRADWPAIAASESIEGSRYGADYYGTCDTFDCGE